MKPQAEVQHYISICICLHSSLPPKHTHANTPAMIPTSRWRYVISVRLQCCSGMAVILSLVSLAPQLPIGPSLGLNPTNHVSGTQSHIMHNWFFVH